MKEQYISLETAKIAKEKGFDWPCIFAYDKLDMLCHDLTDLFKGVNYNSSWMMKSAPAQFFLQKWLRERHGIHIAIRRLIWHGQVEYNDFVYPSGSDKHTDTTLGNEWETYEEALENALQEALKLI